MHVNHCGIHFTHKNFKIARPAGSGDYLFLYTKTPTYFRIDGAEILTPKHSVFIFKKNAPQFFWGAEDIYINDYIHFDTDNPEDEAFVDRLQLLFNTPLALSNVRTFMNVQQQIVYETQNRSENSADAINLLLRYFLIKLSESMELHNKKYEPKILDALNTLRSNIYKEPSHPWQIRKIAKQLNFSESYFQKIYKDTFHVPCITDVINARIEMAKNLLILTSSTSREIADLCGYQNETHFSRQFKQLTGKTPQEYRKTGV